LSFQLSKAPANELAATTKATAKPMASRKREISYLFFMARQFGAGAAIEAAVTTNATAKPMATSKMATTYLLFMETSVHREGGHRSRLYDERDPQTHGDQEDGDNIFVFHGAADPLALLSPRPIVYT
jgi:hypothetical protein